MRLSILINNVYVNWLGYSFLNENTRNKAMYIIYLYTINKANARPSKEFYAACTYLSIKYFDKFCLSDVYE